MKRHLVSSLLLASVISGCSMVRLSPPQLNGLGVGEPAAKEGEPKAAAAEGKSTDSPAPKDTAPKDAAPADVVHRLKGFTADDAYSLSKIAEAFKLVTPELVRYIPSAETYVAWDPSPYETGKFFRSVNDRKFGVKDCNASGFRIQSGYRRELEEGLCSPDKAFEHVAAGTPVVVWSIQGNDAVLVTLDGGRYETSRPEELPLRPHGAAKDAASPALQHTFFGVAELRKLAQIDAAAKPTFESAEATSSEYVKCNLAIYDKQEKEMAAVLKASGVMTSAQEEAKLKPIGDRYRKQQEQSCDKHLAKLEKTLAGFVEERSAARRKLWEGTASLRASLAGKP